MPNDRIFKGYITEDFQKLVIPVYLARKRV